MPYCHHPTRCCPLVPGQDDDLAVPDLDLEHLQKRALHWQLERPIRQHGVRCHARRLPRNGRSVPRACHTLLRLGPAGVGGRQSARRLVSQKG
eukprot:10282735-Lingulodinium_polyedra.AAC.1